MSKAYAQKIRDQHNSDWIIFDGEGNELNRLSGVLTDSEVMAYIRFTRKYELEGLNKGISYGKNLASKTDNSVNSQLKIKIHEVERMKLELAYRLENLTTGS